MSPSLTSKVSFGISAVDVIVATICAAKGDKAFVWFAVLAGIMWAQGLYFRAKAEKETGE